MKKLGKWIRRIVLAVGFSVLYYLLFSFFFDTPIESELKQGNEQLAEQYDELMQSYDSLSQALINIEERDRAIYKIIYEAEPLGDKANVSDDDYLATLNSLSNRELSDLMKSGLDSLLGSSGHVSRSRQSSLELINSDLKKYNSVPSIQPVNNKNLTLLAASYGNKIHPFYKSKHFHKGVDYAVPVGTAVFATADGRVERIETRGQSSGLSIRLNHPSGYKTFYANLDKVLVRPGAQVMRGDIIAFSGNSGLSFAPHLHYEVQFGGESVDPLPYFFAELSIDQASELRRLAEVAMQSFD